MKLEFWFDFASNYSYLSVMRIRSLAPDGVVWRPFLLGPIFKDAGWDNSPFVLQKDKGDYALRQDMPRQCAKYGLPWRQPSIFPRNSLLAARVGLLCEDQPWMLDFCERVMLANFAEDRDIDLACMTRILSELGQDAAAILRAATGDDNKARLRARTEQAKAHRIFGAPTFLLGDAMFWGNDRLEDALAASSSQSAGGIAR
ncbi:2-hydroxychromene-2-carboxylate isomerase [Duganella aceris]|uniref:2-hydroxychromene-2-carboxylate isomerase n=1 Tax=Duganella aceris TaxID=2703883 RepID=A0ABX0FT75_9BURK|nr:2-hydroxychromene-2-carboxylate isomerase [Duganella aceris]NGZ87896.1 2-hydroxychromene-2-carboxylate isomerase [Duganella aceris]